jgi:hypothetical protein
VLPLLGSEGVPRLEAMEPPPPFRGAVNAVGSSDIRGLSSDDGIDGIPGDAPTRLTNMAWPCVGQTPGAYSSVDKRRTGRGTGRDDERASRHGDEGRPPLLQ